MTLLRRLIGTALFAPLAFAAVPAAGEVIDRILVNVNASGQGPNVLLVEHLPSFAVLDPNKKRDLDAQKAVEAVAPKTQQEAAVAGFDKYRTFVGAELWEPVEFTK